MREKRPALVITFPTTAAAMGCEELCEAKGLPGRTIPVPGEVAAGGGISREGKHVRRPPPLREINSDRVSL